MSSFATPSAKGSSAVKSIYTLFVFLERFAVSHRGLVSVYILIWFMLQNKIKTSLSGLISWFWHLRVVFVWIWLSMDPCTVIVFQWLCVHAWSILLTEYYGQSLIINHSAVRFFCNMSCHLCFSRFPSNILQSPEAPESINLDRWVFYGARRYISSHTQTRCRVHILTNWWDRFVAYKWHQFAGPADDIGCLHATVCVSVHQKSSNLGITTQYFLHNQIFLPCV